MRLFTVDGNGGSTELTLRSGLLVNEDVKVSLAIDTNLVKEYNTKTGAKIVNLPGDLFTLQVLDDKGQVIEEGLRVNVVINKQSASNKVKVNVTTMSQKVVMPNGEEVEEPLKLFENYAIPVKIEKATTLSGKSIPVQTFGSNGIMFLDRKFSQNVMHLEGGNFGLIYKENTLPQGAGKVYSEDKHYPEWTCQYSFNLDRVNENTGLLYPNLRTTSESPLYMTLYGGSITLFAGSGKVGLNQPKFENFKFKPNTWYHMSITFKMEEGRPVLKLYINGELAYQSFWPKKVDEWPIIFIGNNSFVGYLRELRFWSKALTAGEINSTLWFADPNSEGLEVYLPLEKDAKDHRPGKENDWILCGRGTTHFNKSFNFPSED